MTMNRRSLITGLISLVAAPAIVRAESLMPVRATKIRPVALVIGDSVMTGCGYHPTIEGHLEMANRLFLAIKANPPSTRLSIRLPA